MVKLRRWLMALTIPLILVVSLLSTTPVLAASQRYEYYSTGDDAAVEIYGNIWGAQTFTTGTEGHTIDSVRLKIYREGTPSTTTVSIRETSGGDPAGADLTSGTMDGDTITTSTSGVWYSFNLTSYSLEASTMYAIVVRAVAGDATNSIHWRSDASAGAEPNGQEETSDNAGTIWTGDSDDDFMFEVWGEPLLDVVQAQVFRGYLEDDDMLFTIEYKNTYVPYYPNSDPSGYFDLQLRSTDGATVYHQTACQAWGNRPGAIYINADSAASLVSGTAYRIYLYGAFGSNPADYYTLQAIDWHGDAEVSLDTWVLLTAHSLEDYYQREFTTVIGDVGEVLNEEGGVIFNRGIPQLSVVRPDLFQVLVQTPTYEPEEWTDAFQEATTWQDQVGPQITIAFNNMGGIINLSGKNVGAMLIVIACIAVVAIVVGKGHTTEGMILIFPFIIGGAWLRLIDIIIVGIVAAVVSLILVWRIWWSRT